MCVLVYNFKGEEWFWTGKGLFTQDVWEAKHYNSETADYWCNRITRWELSIAEVDDYL